METIGRVVNLSSFKIKSMLKTIKMRREQAVCNKIFWSVMDVDGPIRGCNIHDHSEWVWYPQTGKAWQTDKFINEQVADQMKKMKVKSSKCPFKAR